MTEDPSLRDPRARGSGLQIGLRYPSPFFDIASLFLPPRIKDLFKYCQLYAMSDEIISATLYKLAQYPITDIVYETEDDDLKERWKNALEGDLAIRTRAEEAGLDYNCYGNYIASLYTPFIRLLICPTCEKQTPLKGSKFQFKPRDWQFYHKCPKCSPSDLTAHRVKDRPITKVTKGMNIVRWDPQHIDIDYNPISGNSTYYYNLPNQFKRSIWTGKRSVLEETPLAFIHAARSGARVELDPELVLHMKRPSMSYFDHGWGLPLIVPMLKSKYYYQILLKSREALFQQHITPLWMLFPLPQANLDPHQTLSMAKWRQEIESNLRRWRRDPNHISIFPIPTGFQQVGGDAKALSVIDEMKFLQETMIVGLQVPREFLLGGASWSGTSVTFRMLENFFMNHVRGLQSLMRFTIKRISKATGLKEIGISMTRLKWVDDVQQKSILFQANQAGKISDDTMVKELGHDMTKEMKKMVTEQEDKSKLLVAQAKGQAEAQGEATIANMRYQAKATMEQAKINRDLEQEYTAMGFSKQEIQSLLSATQMMKPAGGQFQPGGVLKEEPNRSAAPSGLFPADKDPEVWAKQFVSVVKALSSTDREMIMLRLQMENPQLHATVTEKLLQGGGVDDRPLPEQKPPRRKS